MRNQKPNHLIWASLLGGLAFAAYEIAGLTLIVMFVALLFQFGLSLFRRKEAYLGAAVCALIIAPDLLTNLAVSRTF